MRFTIFPKGQPAAHATLLDEYLGLEAELAATTSTLQAAIEDAEREVAHLRGRHDEAFGRLQQRRAELAQAAQTVSRRRDLLEGQVRQAADPRIDALLDELVTMRDALRHQVTRSEIVDVSTTGERRAYPGSNLDAVQAVSNAIGRAREQAEALKLTSVEDLPAALDAIHRSVPTVRELEARGAA